MIFTYLAKNLIDLVKNNKRKRNEIKFRFNAFRNKILLHIILFLMSIHLLDNKYI